MFLSWYLGFFKYINALSKYISDRNQSLLRVADDEVIARQHNDHSYDGVYIK